MEEIDLKELLGKILEKKSTILLLTAIFIVIGFIYSSFIVVPQYASSVKLVLAQSTLENDSTAITTTDITLNSKLISTYTEIIKSSKVIRQVISNLGIEDKEGSLRGNVSVAAETGTDIIKIRVLNTDSKKAADIANEMAVVFTEEVKRLYGIDNVNILDAAEPNNVPSNINLTKTMIIFGAVGLIIAVAYIFVIYMLDNSVKSSDEVEKVTQIPVLASIPVYEPETQGTSKRSRNKKRSKGGKK